VALSDRKPTKSQGRIAGDMERSRRGSWRLLRSAANPAVTHFRSWGLPGCRKGMRLYVLKPETGKTHQLRAAMKANGAPILGDPLYASAEDARLEDRCYLHATALRLPAFGVEHGDAEEGSGNSGSDSEWEQVGGLCMDVILPPEVGMEFASQAFADGFHTHFNEAIGGGSSPGEVWFPDTKLLSSSRPP